ncbi:pyridoxamine 5'-phosphate oxidase [Methylosinus sp. R-45379]|uniref:pyridoxamine 5'-phosphate oxidase family protein n=1 Tax=Methylosinus sp. R-45379 TaxID=980563 RepID=UPI0007C95F94|nr:pyridoxamine 5'-phosphate oxidase family protein [Methylosinus sp. R-45379]OAI27294.1 pyridoxamine 5'-phosphate oxidase [Methylosinus sp. R-45379]
MSKFFASIEPQHRDFIEKQRLFFVASAASGARVNVSPKSADTLRLIDERSAVYIDRTGSGNETAAHMRADGRLTFMFCALDGAPLILRLYGRGRALARGGEDYARLLRSAFGGAEPPGARQMILLDVESVQTSCGFAVPLYDYAGERDGLDRWAASKGEDALDAYRREKNRQSIDGLPTGLFEDENLAAEEA